jgi:hypothetical protein
MSLYRYSRWDGTQNLPPFDADDVLEALSDDILAEGDVLDYGDNPSLILCPALREGRELYRAPG